MFFYSLSVVAATLIASLIWIAIGWQNGASFVMMTAVACSFFAATDRPAPFIFSMFIWCAISVVASFVYLFAVLPAISGYEMLVLVFAPPFLLIGTFIPRPQFNMLAMLLTVNTASFVALQNRFGADFTTFANESLAAVTGVGFALTWTLLTRPFGAEIAARRLVSAGWTDLAETAAGRNAGDYEKLSARMLDRLGQLVPRLASLDDRYLSGTDGFAEVRMGLNILTMQREKGQLPRDGQKGVNIVLSGIAALFKDRIHRRAAVIPSPKLLENIDRALVSPAILQVEGGRKVVDALVGLRRALFPEASGPAMPLGSLADSSVSTLAVAAE
jgi:uncharacterized membrane protein YccC